MCHLPRAAVEQNSIEKVISQLDSRLSRRKVTAIFLLDLDFFTNINARIGQAEGDRVLARIAAFLHEDSRLHVVRYGGDEFLALFSCDQAQQAFEIAEYHRKRLARARLITARYYEKVPVKASFGVAVTGKHLCDCFTALKAAEIALQSAKKQGRNRSVLAPDQPMRILGSAGVCESVIGKSLRGRCRSGDMAFTASIAEPYGVELDAGGLLFVDRSNHQIKRVENKRVYTVCGTGEAGFSADGIEPRKAMLCKPSGIAFHRSTGRLYIADTGNHCIRVMDETGAIRTVCGTGEAGYSGDGSPGRQACLNRPGGVAVDAVGNIYTNDYGNNVIRMVNTKGFITTVAGNGGYGRGGDGGSAASAELDRPYGLCVTPDGALLFIADYGNNSIRRVDLRTGMIETICGTGAAGYSGDGGPGRRACLDGPFWVSLGRKRQLLIADANNHCIRQTDYEGSKIDTLVGGKGAGYIDSEDRLYDVRLNLPAGMVVDTDALYIADYGNNAIRKVWL